jgi:hypothetical protein
LPGNLSELTGWWAGVTTGDFDGDGLLDLVASNWGLNSSYHRPSPKEPLRAWYGDLDDNGSVELVECETEPVNGQPAPRRDLAFLSMGWPGVRARFTTHSQYSMASIETVLGEASKKAREVRAATFASTLFLQRSNHFEVIPLPMEAQLAPAFAVCVGDLDGDGREDLFLSQNFFSMRAEEPRLDAGRGLWLRGQGTGRFTAVPGHVSGLNIYGEQRGAALADFDGDGRLDLAVAQNGDATKLYRNVQANPGLTIRLAGPPGNPHGIGANLRLLGRERGGPIREIHGGSGYWSQDSSTQVLATEGLGSRSPTNSSIRLWVRWPGGKNTTNEVPNAAREIEVSEAGQIKVKP